jgi:cytochrome P450
MYGPVGNIVIREAVEDCLLEDVPVRKGQFVMLDLMQLHYNPEYFPDPFTFRPDRWINS